MAVTVLLAPLFGAIIAGLFWRVIGERPAQIVATALLFLSAILSWVIFLTHDGSVQQITLMRWIDSGSLVGDWAIRLDRLTAVMLIVITTVSALVHLYSFGYMAHDDNFKENESYRPRFFAYLSLFTFAMLMLVTADNLVQLFFGWEGVGLASYLLIGFYFRKQSAGAAAMKAFIVNRVGDMGLILALMVIYFLVDSIQYDDLFAAAPMLAETTVSFLWTEWNAANLIAFLLFVGAMGKSAQLFLHTWLPDAMEGPTPVSALIHAATMVTAGVFLVARMSPLMEYTPQVMEFVVLIGAMTALFAATVGLVQNDIKRVIAYSTCSQLGFMFVAAGVGVYSVAMFHLLTHAFFKAMLFLGAGSVIHGMHHEQDMRNYGGLKDKLPYTFYAMLIGTLAITGVGVPLTMIGFAGFVSKDAIIESTFAAGAGYAFWALVAAAFMTSFYSWRLMFLTFWGTPRGDKHTHEHAHESPTVMLVPLAVLAVGSVLAGMAFYGPFFGSTEQVRDYFGAAIFMAEGNDLVTQAHYVPAWVKVSPFVAMLFGLGLAYMFYIRDTSLPKRLADTFPGAYRFLLNKWYFDEVYEFLFVRPSKFLGRFLWKKGDGAVIDGGINGLAMGIIPFFTKLAGRAQSGFIFHYAFAMVLGIVVIVTFVTLTGGAN
ncbi:NADH-quinone oxidoreductase subunit L [Roseinatronobacter bogoriensis]|uniref:NADH-quinone oxidoreductase subunit L n=1 Tax=Roseinatronobacter bogoriensis subsp. barguzinensis TaxID=441209 RepID=A0A2K8KA68_9RHOB|nr:MULTISPECIES: NADH-quinone oxidoreductase subunit L [Rhodobaca]ATX66324.1 NADH-quinone oxidoreductase subunit L [Rhodobaca barguzinensis]MBB4207455.1 NADH-quinone oxidoreductase subunit L [Rhodobaca bogoriensis DSM 18756]TDW40238.1 NADH dehydrogenase subunit L [Rhodobaca barguzinensis]TDY70610.1 NADH dehydrogenase subunit L [Rhodobaca bogoriensis DSM 18756]